MGVVGFCFYLITIVNDLPSFYYALTWLAAGVLGSSLGIAFLSLIGLRCAWRVPRDVVTENFSDDASGPTIEFQIANAGTLNKTGVLLEVLLERVPDERRFSRRFLLEALPSGNSITTSLPLRHLRRGRYRVVEVHLIGSDVLGLFSIRKRVAPGAAFNSVLEDGGGSTPALQSGSEIIVGPAALMRPGTALSLSLLTRREGGVPITRSLGRGDDIRGTRLYVPGDDLRHVHWKSTARKNQLVVKEFHHTVQEQTLVVWDGAVIPGEVANAKPKKRTDKAVVSDSEMEAAVDVGFNAREWGLRLTASLCRAFLENHRPCALLRLDGSPLGLGMSDDLQAAPVTMTQISEALANAQTNRTTGLSEAFAPFQARWGGGEIYLVTTTDSDATALVRRLRATGAHVIIGLVDAAAFGPRVPAPAKQTRRQLRKQSQPATPEYSAARRALREAGARVVMVAPAPASRDFTAPILSAVQEILESTTDRQESVEKPESLPAQSQPSGLTP